MTPSPLLLGASLLALLLAPLAQTQQKPVCPWITEGTAAATLGGPVASVVHLEGDPDQPIGSCTFTLQHSPAPPVLEIAVSSAPSQPACPDNSPKLTGIGNEATLCRFDRRYVLTGRVRDLFFRATLSPQPTAPQPSPNQQDTPQHQLENVAEQVAGNLF